MASFVPALGTFGYGARIHRYDLDRDSDMTADELLDLTRELVSIASHEDETAVGDVIEDWLREETDATVERDAHGNVLAHYGPQAEFALVGHHDVVPPDDEQTDDDKYRVEVRDGRLFGRGSADMKGAVAAMLCAIRDNPTDGLAFASFVGEEVGGTGARAALDDGYAPEYALVGEGSTGYSAPGVTDVAIAHKGRRASTLDVTGVAAHASEPEAGENAIYTAADAIEAIRDLSAPKATVRGQAIEGSLAITQIEGGSAWNVIPEKCVITIDERTVPGDRAPLESVATDEITWTVDQDLLPMACHDETFIGSVLEAARAAQPGTPQQVCKPHATDAGWLADAGTTCLVCGPAEPGEAHTATESVSIDVLERCREIYTDAADRVL